MTAEGGQGIPEQPEQHRHHEGPFVASETGLRDVALEPLPGHRLLQRLRFVPFLLLLALVVIAAVVGTATLRRLDPIGAIDSSPRAVGVVEACAPTPAANEGLPIVWSGARAAAAEETFLENVAMDSPAYIVGRDGVHFFSDAYSTNFSQALGRSTLSDADLKAWNDYFVALQAELTVRGIDLVIQVGPANWDVYPETLPEWAQDLRGPNTLDRLIAAHPNVPIVDPRQVLASADHPTYSALNSHWSPYGAALAWRHFAECMAVRDSAYDVLPVGEITRVDYRDAPSEFAALGVGDTATDWTVPKFAEGLAPVHLVIASGDLGLVPGDTVSDFGALPANSRNDAGAPLKALIFRDSMGNDLSVHWQQAFEETVQLANGFDTGARPDIVALADQHQPDLVIVEFAERYLGTPPVMPAASAAG